MQERWIIHFHRKALLKQFLCASVFNYPTCEALILLSCVWLWLQISLNLLLVIENTLKIFMHCTLEGNFKDYQSFPSRYFPLFTLWQTTGKYSGSLRFLMKSYTLTLADFTPFAWFTRGDHALFLVFPTHFGLYFESWDSFSCISLNEEVVLDFKKAGLSPTQVHFYSLFWVKQWVKQLRRRTVRSSSQ